MDVASRTLAGSANVRGFNSPPGWEVAAAPPLNDAASATVPVPTIVAKVAGSKTMAS